MIEVFQTNDEKHPLKIVYREGRILLTIESAQELQRCLDVALTALDSNRVDLESIEPIPEGK